MFSALQFKVPLKYVPEPDGAGVQSIERIKKAQLAWLGFFYFWYGLAGLYRMKLSSSNERNDMPEGLQNQPDRSTK